MVSFTPTILGRDNSPNRRDILIGLISLSLGWLPTNFATAASPPNDQGPLVRELFVPFEDLDVVLKGGGRRVFLTRDEYDELLKKASVSAEQPAPRKTALVSADYKCEVDGPRATIRGTIFIDVTASGLHAIMLPLQGCGLLSATLDDKPAAISHQKDGVSQLFLEGRGRHELKLDLVLSVEVSAAQQTLQFQVPHAGAGRFELTVPGNVEVKSGMVVLQRSTKNNATQLQLLPQAGMTSLVLSLNNEQADDNQVIVARTVLIDELTETYERLHVTAAMQVPHGATEVFRFTIPDGFDITDVTTPLLSRWQVVVAEGQATLEVRLREAASGTQVLNISAQHNAPKLADWQMPRLSPLDVAGSVSVVGLLVEARLEAKTLQSDGLIPIDVLTLTSTLPTSIFHAEPGAPAITPIAAYFSPDSNFALSARFELPPDDLEVATNQVLKLSDSGHELTGGFTLIPLSERLFGTSVIIEAGWEVTWFRLRGLESDLEFDTYELEDGRTRLQVKFPHSVEAGETLVFHFAATWTPEDWLSEWETREVEFPFVEIREATFTRGAIAVQTEDDLVVQDQATSGLQPLDEREKARHGLAGVNSNLAFFFERAPISATFEVQRVPAKITAETYSFLKIEPGRLLTHFEMAYEVSDSRTRELSFRLPLNTPKEIGVDGLDGAEIKEFTSQENEDSRRWNVTLVTPARGTVRIRIQFEQPLKLKETATEGGKQLADALSLPVIAADDVAYQTGSIAVEGSSELEIELNTDARKVDVGELIDATYKPGQRLLGAFGFVGNPTPVTAKVMRPIQYALPSAIIQRGELVSAFSATGVCQTAARFQLRAKSQFVEVQLPKGSTLWSAYLDGRPSKPQRNAERLLVSIPQDTNRSIRDLQLVYETPRTPVGIWSDLSVSAPKLFLQDDPAEPSVEVPMADVAWQVSLPAGYRLTNSNGTVFPGESSVQQPLSEYQTRLETIVAAGTKSRGALLHLPLARSRARSSAERIQEQIALRLDWSDAATDSADDAAAESMSERARPEEEMDKALENAQAKIRRSPRDRQEVADVLDASELAAPPSKGRSTIPDNRPRPANPAFQNDETGGFPVEPIVNGELRTEQDAPANQSDAAGKRLGSGNYWVLEGLRSLEIDIDLSNAQPALMFEGLGENPTLQLRVIDYHRFELLAWGIAFLVFTIGLVFVNRSLKSKVRYVVLVLVSTTLLPLIVGWQQELGRILDLTFYAGLTLIVVYFAAAIGRSLKGRCFAPPPPIPTAAALVCCILFGFASESPAQQETEAQVGPIRVKLLGPEPTVTVPNDVVIVPYNPDEGTEAARTEKVIVPYDKFVELWDLAYPDRKLEFAALPAEFAWSGATWMTTLVSDEFLLLEGELTVDTFVNRLVAVPIALSGGVLEQATMNGAPARLAGDRQAGINEAIKAVPIEATQQPSKPNVAAEELALKSILLIDEKGHHTLKLTIRFPLERRGGWRVVDGVLPQVPATRLTVQVPTANTEVRMPGSTDRSDYETSVADEQIVTALASTGQLRLQWRPKVAQAAVDRSLTTQSDAVFDVQEDSLRLVWQMDLLFPRATRDVFEFKISDDYLVERITGENIRTWRRESDNRIEVTLLNSVRDRQRLTLHLAKRGAVGVGVLQNISVPVIEVPDAVLHEGRIALRRSPLLNIRATETVGVARTDLASVQTAKTTSSESPLGIKPYQAYRFGRTPYQLGISVSRVPVNVSANVQTLLRIGENTRRMESRILLRTNARPIHRITFQLPTGFEPQDVVAPGIAHSATTEQDGVKRLTIHLGSGQLGEFSVVLSGDFENGNLEDGDVTDADDAAPNGVPIPKLVVADVTQQTSQIVVQTDPSFNARAEQLTNCEVILLERSYGWLQSTQRSLARLAIQAKHPDYSGNITLQKRTPRISCRTVSNLRVTHRAFEETILLDFTIQDAGTREVSFLIPSDLRDARISTPLIRRKTIEDISADQIRVRLSLKDAVMGQLRVLVEHDRLVSSDERVVPIPVVETGELQEQFVALESAGRDEVVVARSNEIEPLGRQQRQWTTLASILGDQVTQAFLVSSKAQAPQLVIQARARQTVETAGARIAFAETLLVVDESGGYRGTQTYRVDNRIEQFLEVVLPQSATLWTAMVAGEPVKPMAGVAAGSGSGTIRIPLVKTAEGDQDYPVQLKYGGSLEQLKPVGRVDFPLMQTRNIKVEESQVRLRLPKSQQWFDFGGTMRHVAEREELVAGYLQYKTQKLLEFTSGLSSSNPYARARCLNNMKLLVDELEGMETQSWRRNANLAEQLDNNRRALEIAKSQLRDQSQVAVVPPADSFGNNSRMHGFYFEQDNQRTAEPLSNLYSNFIGQVDTNKNGSSPGDKNADGKLQRGWIDNNQLTNPDIATGGLTVGGRVNIANAGQKRLKGAQSQRGQGMLGSGGYGAGDNGSGSFGRDGRETYDPYAGGAGYGYGGGGANSSEQMPGANAFDAENSEAGYGEDQMRQSGPSHDYAGATAGYGVVKEEVTTKQRSELRNELGRVQRFQQQLDLQTQSQSGQPYQQPERSVTANTVNASPGAPDNAKYYLGEQGARTWGFASLDVAMPVRGQEYLFTTPRGDIQITARPITTRFVDRMFRLLVVLVGLLAAGLIWRFFASVGFDRVFTKRICYVMLIVGVILLFVMPPLIPLLVLSVAIVQLVRLLVISNSRPAMATA